MIINQIHSIGDILFLEPMFRHFMEKNGEKPIVPLRDHLMWLAAYIDSATFRPMSQFKMDYESKILRDDYLPTRWANQLLHGYGYDDHHDFENMMLDKYRLAQLDPYIWKDLKINFDEAKAESLMSNFYEGDFILINNHSQAGDLRIQDGIKSSLPFCFMNRFSNFTVIDWYLMILHAKEFHTVSTSTFYILQAMKNQFPGMETKIFIYPRPNIDGLRGISLLNPTFDYEAINS